MRHHTQVARWPCGQVADHRGLQIDSRAGHRRGSVAPTGSARLDPSYLPLGFLTAFQKRDDVASEGALKFFLIGTVSSAILLYGVTGSTSMAVIPAALASGHVLAKLGLVLVLGGVGFKMPRRACSDEGN